MDPKSALQSTLNTTVEWNHHRFLIKTTATRVGVAALGAIGGVAEIGLQEIVVIEPNYIAIDEEPHGVHRILKHFLHLISQKQRR